MENNLHPCPVMEESMYKQRFGKHLELYEPYLYYLIFQRVFLLLAIGVQESGLKISKNHPLCGQVLTQKT